MPSSNKTKKILIAEDEKTLADILALKFKKAGYKVKNVVDGEEVIQALSKDKFDLLLLDLIMPKKNGLEVLEEIKTKKIKLKIIITSNLSQPEAETKARSLGVKEFFVKSEVALDDVVKKAVSILG